MRLIKNVKVVIMFALFGSIFGNSCNTVPHESGVTFHKTYKFKLIFRMQDMVIETLFEHEF